MKKQTFRALLMAAVVGFTAVSCEKELTVKQEPVETQDEILLPEGEGEFVLRDRDPEHPFVVKAPIDYGAIRTKAGQDISKHLGESFKLDSYPFASSKNLGHLRVFDYEKYIQDYPSRYYEATIQHSYAHTMTFSDFESYDNKRSKTENYSAGLDVSCKVFKIIAKDTYKKIFNETETSLREHVFGEYYSRYLHKEYGLEIDNSLWGNQSFTNYIHPDFLNSLYSNSPKSFIEQYGAFFLKEYVSGAQILLRLEGKLSDKSGSTSTDKENNFQFAIEASIKSKYIDSVGVNGTFINTSGESSSYQKKFTYIDVYSSTFGGFYGVNDTAPRDLSSATYDFSLWYNSLSNPENLVLTELRDGSLIPITAFIEEENLKQEFKNYYLTGNTSAVLQEPKIAFIISDEANNNFKVIRNLVTRYGNSISMGTDVVNKNQLNEFIKNEYIKYSTAFPYVKIVCNRGFDGDKNEGAEAKPLATIMVSPSSTGGRNIKTYIGKFAGDGILVRDVDLPTVYTADYLRAEKARLSRTYSGIVTKVQNTPGYVWPVSGKGCTIDQIPRLNYIYDRSLPTIREIEAYYKGGEVFIPSTLTKFVDNKTGKTYILDEFQRIGYTLYDQDVMDCYSGGEFVRRIPNAQNITVKDIRRNYNLIAL
ncbi:MAG: hypothetical protein LIR35_07835 [Bacteroidota bacterium]|nr:hypothetical protein [Bacteroidota bacterium]